MNLSLAIDGSNLKLKDSNDFILDVIVCMLPIILEVINALSPLVICDHSVLACQNHAFIQVQLVFKHTILYNLFEHLATIRMIKEISDFLVLLFLWFKQNAQFVTHEDYWQNKEQ